MRYTNTATITKEYWFNDLPNVTNRTHITMAQSVQTAEESSIHMHKVCMKPSYAC